MFQERGFLGTQIKLTSSRKLLEVNEFCFLQKMPGSCFCSASKRRYLQPLASNSQWRTFGWRLYPYILLMCALFLPLYSASSLRWSMSFTPVIKHRDPRHTLLILSSHEYIVLVKIIASFLSPYLVSYKQLFTTVKTNAFIRYSFVLYVLYIKMDNIFPGNFDLYKVL